MDSWDEEMIPIPVKFELTPIVNLFTQENLDERHGIRCELERKKRCKKRLAQGCVNTTSTQPIATFLEHLRMSLSRFSSEAILRWFLPLYLDFCDVFGFDCSRERGCGFDDNCDFEEDCVVDVLSGPGRYRCQGSMLGGTMGLHKRVLGRNCG